MQLMSQLQCIDKIVMVPRGYLHEATETLE